MFIMSGKSESEMEKRAMEGSDKLQGVLQARLKDILGNPSIITGMSHEMRTQMNAIVAFSYLINNSNITEEERAEFTEHIINSCEQLVVLFDNFFDSAIIDSGNSANEIKRCNLNQLISKLMGNFRGAAAKENKDNIELIHDECTASPSDLFIDDDKASRVLRALFLNALESTSAGYIRLGYVIKDGNALFHMLDSGNGYESARDHFQLGEERKNYSINSFHLRKAIMFDLAIKLVNIMGGEIGVERNGVAGTGIRFSVPVKEAVRSGGAVNTGKVSTSEESRNIRQRIVI